MVRLQTGEESMKRTLVLGIGAFLSVVVAAPHLAEACSRAVYFGVEGQTVTGRTMDWFVSDMDTNYVAVPARARADQQHQDAADWKSKYGSVVTTIYEGAAADGMNEKGLVANLLYLAESEYPARGRSDTRPTLPISAWVQYVLDNYATTAEAVEGDAQGGVPRGADHGADGRAGHVHLSISDASGDSAIFEYIERQAGDPPRPRVPGDDQLARLSTSS